MKTAARQLFLSAALAIGFLSAGAFGGSHEPTPVVGVTNVTIIMKTTMPSA